MTAEEQIMELVKRISPLLKGKAPPVQGAVLADLLAMWLAGHWIPGDADETRAAREAVLANHIQVVRELMEENAKILGTHEE
jgi:hypothetical protein